MMQTFYLSKDEVKEAITNYINKKLYSAYSPNEFSIGFLDEHEKNVDVNLIQVFRDIE